MVVINEWLPNPQGKDTEGEWLELFNAGEEDISLSGWTLSTGGRSVHHLGGTLGAGAYRVFHRSETRLALRNTDGMLVLADPSGTVRDTVSFIGTAPEGESVSRMRDTVLFSSPTPGFANEVVIEEIRTLYPFGVPINALPNMFFGAGAFLGTALLCSSLILFIVKNHDTLRELFFEQN